MTDLKNIKFEPEVIDDILCLVEKASPKRVNQRKYEENLIKMGYSIGIGKMTETKQMTKQNQRLSNIIEIDGVKYQRVEQQQSFYDKLWGLLKTKIGNTIECDYMTDQVRDLIRERIPSPTKSKFMSEYLSGYNEAIRQVKENLFNGIL